MSEYPFPYLSVRDESGNRNSDARSSWQRLRAHGQNLDGGPVPEPASLLLFGTDLSIMARRLRSTRSRSALSIARPRRSIAQIT